MVAVPTTRVQQHQRHAAALFVGLALTVIAALAPIVDIATIDTIGDHVRAAYPQWSPALVAEDRNAIAIYMVATNIIGIIGWLATIGAVLARRRWARGLATTLFAFGLLYSLLNLGFGGAAYHVVVPTDHGLLTLLPTLAGLVALVSLWRGRTNTSR